MPHGCNAGCLAPSFHEAHPLRAGVIFMFIGGRDCAHERLLKKMPHGCNAGCLTPSFRKAFPLRAGVIFSLIGGRDSGHERLLKKMPHGWQVRGCIIVRRFA
jgi:hypothetical protein